MDFEDIIYDVDDHGVATITFNRPDRMNAVRPQMSEEIGKAVTMAREDDAVRVLVLTGAGRGFCAGDDFQAIFLNPDSPGRAKNRKLRRLQGHHDTMSYLFGFEKPTIASVNGVAVGYGMDLSLYCDIRIASEAAKFGWFFTRRGVLGTVGGTYILRQLVGLSKAMELMYTGDLIDAKEAERIGLVSRVVANDDLAAETRALARKIASGPPLAQRAVKRAVQKGFEMNWRDLEEYQQALGDVLWETEDHREGVNSFVEKRDPVFKGR